MRLLVTSSGTAPRRLMRIANKQMRSYSDDEDASKESNEVSSSGIGLVDDVSMEDEEGEVSSSVTHIMDDIPAIDDSMQNSSVEAPTEISSSSLPVNDPALLSPPGEVTSSEIPMLDSSLDDSSEVSGFNSIVPSEAFFVATAVVASPEVYGNDVPIVEPADEVRIDSAKNIVSNSASEGAAEVPQGDCATAAAKANNDPRGKSIHNGYGRGKGSSAVFQALAASEGEDKDYEVEAVRDYRPGEGGGIYLVKWKNWDERFNTWEPAKNLHSCRQVLTAFYLERREAVYDYESANFSRAGCYESPVEIVGLPSLPPDPRTIEDIIAEFTEEYPIADEEVEEWVAKYGVKFPRPSMKKDKISRWVAKTLWNKLSQRRFVDLRNLLIKNEVHIRYKEAQQSLEDWKKALNLVTGGKPAIKVENEVDLTEAPQDFVYLTESRISCNIEPSKATGCPCKGLCFAEPELCTSGMEGLEFAYSRLKRVVVPPGYPIFECHNFCECTETCPNRVAGNGHDSMAGMSFSIFRTRDREWGVKTLKAIRKGAFVMLLVGEVITMEEALARQHSEDPLRGKFVFHLGQYCQGNNNYSIDFTTEGNLTRFMNHSCSPNLVMYPNWLGHKVSGVPRVALYAAEEIPANSELTYSYVDVEEFRRTFPFNQQSQCPEGFTPCLCRAPNCVRFMVFQD